MFTQLNVNYEREPISQKKFKDIIIDGISFVSIDAAIMYLVQDGMTGEQAMKFICGKEWY